MKALVRLLPAVLWMGAIFYLSSRTADDMGGWLSEIQKLIPFMESLDWGHFLAYFILAITYAWAFRVDITLWDKVVIVGLCVLYGITDELHQIVVPGRMPDMKDLVNDAIGASLAMLFISIPLVRACLRSWKCAKYY
jgi:VanZ family protein